MTEEERRKILEDMREAFRKARPDLNLPPARKSEVGGTASSAPSGDEAALVRAERREEVKAKTEAVREAAREQPKTIAKMLKKYTDWNGKK